MRAADAELAAARPLRDNGFKVALARGLIARTLEEVCL
jgi:xanthine dehydrogenase YagS FAD-binding subunit